MTEMTPLDLAHAAMEAAPGEDATRLRFFERLADSELFLLLEKEPEGDRISPDVFDTGEGRFVLVFDREERLAAFADRIVPYAALSGRVIAQMLAGQGIGLGVNLEVAPSSILIPAEAMGWLAETLANAPGEVEAAIAEVHPPKGLPEALLTALDAKLATAAGLAQCAYLAAVTYEGGGSGHLLAFVNAREGAETALAKAVGEALTFSCIEAGALDVGFFAASAEISGHLARMGLRFELPEPQSAQSYQPIKPGSDPDKPPRLK
ncbi:SseB family protein [Phaeobacter sp. HF9A]|uniref:SseB family protein n=1 Tax=Phaeobacter sp. HF9A TaxID=2721561 RepID=UPI00142F5E7D|nr:SseB family protein [Phaeobacter sp. HF9A]NIZ14279.1 SseB family protein [Phaeobacter sp. HF9A]